jgi:hypothetical protein
MSQIRTNSIVPSGGVPAGASGGGIIQVVTATKTDTFTTNTVTFTDLTGLSASITPRSTSNKVLIIVSIGLLTGAHSTAFKLVRGATDIGIGVPSGNRVGVSFRGSVGYNDDHGHSQGIHFLDSPSTTSSTTYKVQISVQTGQTATINRSYGDINSSEPYGARTISTLTLLEISG